MEERMHNTKWSRWTRRLRIRLDSMVGSTSTLVVIGIARTNGSDSLLFML